MSEDLDAVSRYRFQQEKAYAGRLFTSRRKPIENQRLALIRLEFEIFQMLDGDRLVSTGKVACRDVVVGAGADVSRDEGAMTLVGALRVTHPDRAESWLSLARRQPWVRIEFGPLDTFDYRNAFQRIFPFDAANLEIREYDYDLNRDWLRIGEAAEDLGVSASTIRRRIAEWETEWGEQLLRKSAGGHRYLNIRLLRNLWNDEVRH